MLTGTCSQGGGSKVTAVTTITSSPRKKNKSASKAATPTNTTTDAKEKFRPCLADHGAQQSSVTRAFRPVIFHEGKGGIDYFGLEQQRTASFRFHSSQSPSNRPGTPDGDDNALPTLLPAPPPSSPRWLHKKRKLEASTMTGSRKRFRNFILDDAIDMRESESDGFEERAVITITDSDD